MKFCIIMKRNVLVYLFFCCLALTGWAQDPFSGTIGSIVEDELTPFVTNTNNLVITAGIAVTGIPAEGGWSFYDGSTWWDFRRITENGPISPTNALLLPFGTPIRYSPPRDFYGTTYFDYITWDQSEGSSFFGFDGSGSEAFGESEYRVNLIVTPVNDPPKLTGNKQVVNFDGANDYVSFPPTTMGGEMTFETWFYVLDANQTWIRLFEFAGPAFGDSGNNLVAGFRANTGTLFYAAHNNVFNQFTSAIIPEEEWVHAAFVHSNNRLIIYLNSVEILNVGVSGPVPNSTRPSMYIAKSNYPQDNYYGGNMRNFRVWDRPLSPEEIQLSYGGVDITGDGSDLLANFSFEGVLTNQGTHPNKFGDAMLNDGANFAIDNGPPAPVTRYVNNPVPLSGMIIQDVDGDTALLSLSIPAPTGVLNIVAVPGVVVTGNGTPNMTLRGQMNDINTALAYLVMNPTLNWIGNLDLSYVVDDLGYFGAEGDMDALTAPGVRKITILPLPCESPANITCNPLTLEFNGEASFLLDEEELVTIAEGSCEIASVQLSTSSISCQQLGQTVPVNVVVTDANGAASACTSQITVGGLPCGWRHNSGSVGSCVSDATFAPSTGVWTTTATNCIYNSPFQQDMLMFAQRTLCGDGSITAQVTGISGGLPYAGITMRESNATGSKKVQMMINRSSNTLRREVRYDTGGQAFPMHFSSPCERVWLRLVRTGNTFRGYTSQDGLTWWYVMQVLVPMNSCVEIGLVLTNMQAGVQGTATFANVSYTGGAAQPNAYAPDYGTAIEDMAQLDVNVFPNPASGLVQVDLIQYAGKPVSLEVFDFNGKLVWTREWSAATGATETLDLHTLPVGAYALRVKSAGLTDVTKRILLQRP
jgi:hypothetical protein